MSENNFKNFTRIGMRHMFSFLNVSKSSIKLYIPFKYFKSHLDLPEAQNDIVAVFQEANAGERPKDADGPLDINSLHSDGYIGVVSLVNVSECSIEIIVIPHGSPYMEIEGILN